MAFDTTIDNEGIKKGLGLVVSQLIQSNKKLGDLNLDKFMFFDITENETSHPTKEDCTVISNKIYETIF